MADKIEYVTTPSAEPPQIHHAAPLPIEDLERRLNLLKAAGVREYHDVGVKIAFEPKRPAQKTEDELLAQVESALRAQEEAGG